MQSVRNYICGEKKNVRPISIVRRQPEIGPHQSLHHFFSYLTIVATPPFYTSPQPGAFIEMPFLVFPVYLTPKYKKPLLCDQKVSVVRLTD